MKTTIRTSDSRGGADHGWLKAKHSFSFGRWYDPERVSFGALRVLNDDIVEGGMGFGTHPHDNMEIISVPLEGAVEHKDSMGSSSVIRKDDIQVMTAGTGITHSEFNPNAKEALKMLQLWIFPRERGLTPRYDQKTFDPNDRLNKLQLIVSPDAENGSLMIHQDAWMSLTNAGAGKALHYELKGTNTGVYLFLIKGEMEVDGKTISARDAIEITDAGAFEMLALEDSEALLIEVPLN